MLYLVGGPIHQILDIYTRTCYNVTMNKSTLKMREFRKRKPLHSMWQGMKQRCSNPNNEEYHNYGGRGIRVCERWVNSYEDFVGDMGEKPTTEHSIDRINVNGNYEPGNCRWATWREQTINSRTRSDNKLQLTGIVYDKNRQKYRVNVWVDKKQKFVGRFDTIEEAISARLFGESHYGY